MKQLVFQKIGAGIVSVALGIASLLGYSQAPIPQAIVQQAPTMLGAAPQFTAAKPTFLYGGGISSSATSIRLTSLVTPGGTAITTAQLVGGVGSVFYITIEPATTKKETVSCTAVTQNSDNTATLTGCTRGLQFTYPYTASASLALNHAGGSSVVLSNSPQLYQDIINYVNSSFAAGVNNASTIAKGIGQLATSLQQASSTAIGGGSTDAALLLYSANASSTYTSPANGSNGLNVVVTQNNNKIDNNFLQLDTATTSIRNIATTSANSVLTTVGNPPIRILDIGKTTQIFTTTANFTVPAGVRVFHVRVLGGGGSGGKSTSGGTGNCSGGAAGGFDEGWFDLTGTTTVGVTIGAAGASNSAGGTSWFGSIASSTGGNAGACSTTVSAGTIGGVGFATTSSITINAINSFGQPGGQSSSATSNNVSGFGAGSPLGAGGVAVISGGGKNGFGYGSGGSGDMDGANVGSSGTQGIVIIEY